MPKVNTEPNTLRPYLYHGVHLEWREGAKDAIGDCPFCDGQAKFNVLIATGQYRCVKCNTGNAKGGGNTTTFLQKLLELSLERTSPSDYEELAEGRGLLDPTTLAQWKVAKSITTGEWIVPGYTPSGSLNQLYRYVYLKDKGKHALLPTPTLGHQIFGMNLWDDAKPIVDVMEGPWDGMGWWEMLGRTKETGSGYFMTANYEQSLLATTNVLAMPGCEVFHEGWLSLFSGRHVRFYYDSDHPKLNERTNTTSPPVGYSGVKKAAIALEKCKSPPESISFLKWGEDGFNPAYESGTDVRDLLANVGKSPAARVTVVAQILHDVVPASEDWFEDGGRNLGATDDNDSNSIKPQPCDNFISVRNSWRKAMKWTDGLEHGLVSMLACVASVDAVGSQLWIKVMGPASCGKTTLAEAIAIAKRFVVSRSTIRGFHSGFKYVNKDGEEVDISLAELIRHMTLITKDGDTLLQSPNVGQILSEGRDIYDGVARTDYRNGQGKSYENHRFTWILCGTASLRSLDQSELGERFIDCVIMEEIDDELEDEILWRVVNKADRNLSLKATGDATDQYPPELLEAMQLTGGYVEWLREHNTDLLQQIESPEWALRRCTRLGKFVAHMRARPSKSQDEKSEREFSARLVEQILRYAKCVALVLNKETMDAEVMQRATRVAMDTSRGVTLQITKFLYNYAEEGQEVKSIAYHINQSEEKARVLLRFLREIHVAELFTPEKTHQGVTPRPRWRITPRLHRLYSEVLGQSQEPSYA